MQILDYSGERTLEDLVQYVKKILSGEIDVEEESDSDSGEEQPEATKVEL